MRQQPSRNHISPDDAANVSSRPVWIASSLLVLAALLAFANTFHSPFVYDDDFAITTNTSIKQLWPIGGVLSPPADVGVGGRPFLNLTYAVNYAWGGLNVTGYHVVNIVVHLLAGLTLFGIIRRTLRQPVFRDRFGTDSLPLAAAVALLWLVHPVQTEAVTYISQRAESLMGLLYLLTLYCFIRSTEPNVNRGLWSCFAVSACLLGMATKEVMVTAPLMILIYDRTFMAGTFREAWRQRWRLYAGLASTWLLLAYLFSDVDKRVVGTGYGVTCWTYTLTECRALIHYLALVIWPHPLIIDYGVEWVNRPLDVLPQTLLLIVLLAATTVAFRRWPTLGFVGVWFFLILAPTSSVVPIPLSPVAEHRLYLPLAALITLLVLSLYRWIGKNSSYAVVTIAVVWGLLTLLRNADYHSDLGLWKLSVAQKPDNERAHVNYGKALWNVGKGSEAVEQFQIALRIDPEPTLALDNLAHVENNWGNDLIEAGHYDEAYGHLQEALRVKPHLAGAQYNWGNGLFLQGHFAEAITHYKIALQIQPDFPEAVNNCGNALLKLGQPAQALDCFQKAERLKPDLVVAYYNSGNALLRLGRPLEAIDQFQQALRIDPNYSPAMDMLVQLHAPLK